MVLSTVFRQENKGETKLLDGLNNTFSHHDLYTDFVNVLSDIGAALSLDESKLSLGNTRKLWTTKMASDLQFCGSSFYMEEPRSSQFLGALHEKS